MLAQAASAAGHGHDLRVAGLVLAPLAAITLAAYGRWVAALRTCGGRVETESIGRWDLGVTLFLVSLIGTLSYAGFAVKEAPELSVQALGYDSLFKLVILAGLFAFFAWRKLRPAAFFGLKRATPLQALGWAVLFLLAALPAMIALAFYITKMTGSSDEQQLVSFFRTLARTGNVGGVLAVFFTAVLLAPFFEELLFRGYFYATLKRYFGAPGSAVFVSALFALFHANLNSLAPLFLLALCLTVAYEWTGSLLVTMTMHALFNTMGLVSIYWEAMHPAP